MLNPIKLSLEDYEVYDEDNTGHCINCGEAEDCCDPDTSGLECPSCGLNTVYGAQELLFMGLVE